MITQRPTKDLKKLNRDFLIEWNYRFPLDKWWREKHGVALFSEQHLNISQLTITLEYQEVIVFKEFEELGQELEKKKKDYEQGIWLSKSDPKSQSAIDDLFNKLDVGTIPKDNQLLIEE